MSFVIYDLIFLAIFLIFITLFLVKNKKNLKREGLLYLYKTKWGVKLIDRIGKKHKKLLKILSYVSIVIGYLLMIAILYLFGRIVYMYLFQPSFVQAIKIPPIMPLFPYLPQAFGLDFLPPFYFAYWIIIIALIAIPHEFFHGIFAAKDKIRIKKTGFGFFPFFFPVFLAAFVEPDEKQMSKKSIFSQLSILSAGTFANILTGILFFIILILFFSLAFAPAGVVFDTYTLSEIAIPGITLVNGIPLNNMNYQTLLNNLNEEGYNEIEFSSKSYLITKSLLKSQENSSWIFVYDDAPAINANLTGAIFEIDEEKISSIEDLTEVLGKKSPGQKIEIKVINSEKEVQIFEIELDEDPKNSEKVWLGIGFYDRTGSNLMGKISYFVTSFKNPNVYYEQKWGEFSVFFYNLLWWIVLICFSVALINMVPIGIFDGGRFFYLTILAITKKEKVAKKAFSIMTKFLLLLVLLIMISWAINVF
jgi:membrane-associated protease RseP (regulator of RpoE activity)